MAEKTSLAGERSEGEEIADEALDKVSVDITKVINEVGDQNIKPCLYSFLGQTQHCSMGYGQ